MHAHALSASLEDYLEAIIALEKTHRVARVKDIAARLNVRMPSVTGALKSLKEKGYVNYERNSFISLTDLGLRAANCLQSKREVVLRLFSSVLCIPEERAGQMAGHMEHALDCETTRRLIKLLDYFEGRVRGGSALTADGWRGYIEGGDDDIPFLCSEWCDITYRTAQE